MKKIILIFTFLVAFISCAFTQVIDLSPEETRYDLKVLNTNITPCDAFDNYLWNCGFRDGEELCTTDWEDTGAPSGTADDWDLATGTGTPSIVTGNGFLGNAQRVPHVTGTITRFGQNTGVASENGKTYRITGKYRTDQANWRLYLRANVDLWVFALPVNTGSAAAFSYDVVATGVTNIFPSVYKISGGANSYIEIDELRVWQID